MTDPARKLTVRVRLILFCAGHVLVARDKPTDATFLPGGGLEHGEGTVECLRREFEEECDLALPDRLDIFGLLENRFAWQGSDIHELLVHFVGQLDATEPPAVVSREDHLAFRWLALASLDGEAIWPPESHAAIRAAHAEPGRFHHAPLQGTVAP